MKSSASVLCGACGLCCNGVLFHTVRLQSADSPQELKACGMRIQHKKRYDFFDQPCLSWKENSCSIYEQRPERCRLFECQQLERLARGEITEEQVLNTIQEAQARVAQLQQFLTESGAVNRKKPLSQQYERILAEHPLTSSSSLQEQEERSCLINAFETLQEFLNKEFRPLPIPSLP